MKNHFHTPKRGRRVSHLAPLLTDSAADDSAVFLFTLSVLPVFLGGTGGAILKFLMEERSGLCPGGNEQISTVCRGAAERGGRRAAPYVSAFEFSFGQILDTEYKDARLVRFAKINHL